MPQETRQTAQPRPEPGPFLAKVISHLDPNYMGGLEVEILRPVGSAGDDGNLHQVKYMSPFSGQTSVDYTTQINDYNNTQKSYGMWMVPPDVGATVIVIFIDGDPRKGYWIGCVPDEHQNFMVPGIASTKYNVEGTDKDLAGIAGRAPVAEYNKKGGEASTSDASQIKKPQHPIVEALTEQGLLLDDIRGITTSSARREVPSMVFGISTPGPIDKRSGAQKGKVGKKGDQIAGAFVSRLGGTTFVMDDGDEKFVRKTTASEGPPEYANRGQGDTSGDATIPHNELVRIRTRTGHQILLHNSEDLIYIGNSRGTSWIELSSDGKIDIYAEDSVSLHTKQDLNFYAGRDINLEAGRNLNIKVTEEMHTNVLVDNILIVDGNQKIHVKGNLESTVVGHSYLTTTKNTEIKSGGNHIETATQIHMNGPAATPAEIPKVLKTHGVPDETGAELTQSIMRRVPTHEPYAQHENLDPIKVKPDQTDRDIDGRYEGNSGSILKPSDNWKKYSTTTDTFEKIKPPERGN
jgi:hypothetical protein